MAQLKISDNIMALRKERGITQDELANFLGVTKASVSKWETKQSYPDILLLPQIATFFDITLDELMGYEPQLSKEQIIYYYQELSEEFANKPFEKVFLKSKELVKKYFSCYPFLLHMGILWLNHVSIAPSPSRQFEIFGEIITLCEHVRQKSEMVDLQSDAIVLKSLVELQMGKATEVIDSLLPIFESNHYRLQADSILIQAYQMTGNVDKAELYNQVILFTSLTNLMNNSIVLLCLYQQEQSVCEETIERMDQLIRIYNIEQLMTNAVLQYYYQCALYYCATNRIEKAIERLDLFVKNVIPFLKSDIKFHGDDYFTRIQEWADNAFFGTMPPRSEKTVAESLTKVFDHPQFAVLADQKKFQELKFRISKLEVER